MPKTAVTRAGAVTGVVAVLLGAAGAAAAPPDPAQSLAITASAAVLLAGTGDTLTDLVAEHQVGLGGGTALIMGPGGWPTPGDIYPEAIMQNYLAPMGFTGDWVGVNFPWQNLTSDWDQKNVLEVQALVAAVQQQLDAPDAHYDVDNPLVIVGYSESAVAASKAMEVLHENGVPEDALHFVLIGNTASPVGGLLAGLLPSLPEWLREPVETVLGWLGLKDLLGFAAPTDLYPADTFILPGDMFTSWPSDFHTDPLTRLAEVAVGWFTHLQYPGQSAAQVGEAVLADGSAVDDLARYWDLSGDGINTLDSFWHTAVNMGDVPEWLQTALGGFFD